MINLRFPSINSINSISSSSSFSIFIIMLFELLVFSSFLLIILSGLLDLLFCGTIGSKNPGGNSKWLKLKWLFNNNIVYRFKFGVFICSVWLTGGNPIYNGFNFNEIGSFLDFILYNFFR
jgi:hypothetical protein